MKLLGTEWVPLNLPLKNRLEALAICGVYLMFPVSVIIGSCVTLYTLFFTKYWHVALAYLVWVFLLDVREIDWGIRKNKWVCSWNIFKYAANYFPLKFTTVPGFELNPKKNYLACMFPHGWVPTGAFLGMQTEAIEVSTILPHHSLHGSTFKCFFYAPIAREILRLLGVCSATPEAMSRLLSYSGGGKVVGLVVGGSAETILTRRGQYNLVLKNRKGFVKLSLSHGSPLIPVFSFGETSLYDQKVFPNGSLLRRIQELPKSVFGFPAFLIINGRGFFQYSFGLLPHQRPINVVAGKPIEFEKIENPTQEDIDKLHELFIQKLTELFEEYKYHFEENPENVKLVIS